MRKNEKPFYKYPIFIVSVILTVGVIGHGHFTTWGSHSGTILMREALHIVGLSSDAGLETLSRICAERKQWSCAESTLLDLANRHPDEPERHLQLARFYQFVNRKEDAKDRYQSYFNRGGSRTDIFYDYARLLDHSGQTEQAVQWYSSALEKATDLNGAYGPTRELAQIYLQQRRYDKAFEVIDHFHRHFEGANRYLLQQKEVAEMMTKPNLKSTSRKRDVGHQTRKGARRVSAQFRTF